MIGQLASGTQPTYPPCNQQTGGNNYGRFDLSWTGGGTNATRLSNWLDPTNSGALTTNTTNVSSLFGNYTISGPSSFCTSDVYYIPNLPTGATVSWSTSSPSIASLSSTTGSQVTITKSNAGLFHLTATVTYCGTSSTVAKNGITAGVPLEGNVFAGSNQSLTLKTYAEGANFIYEDSWVYWGLQGTSASQYSLAGGNASWTSSDYFPNVTFYMNPNSYVNFNVSASSNGCSETLSYVFVAIPNPYARGYYSVAPNPVSSDLTIYVDDEKLKSQKIEKSSDQVIQQVIIMGKSGITFKKQNYSSGEKIVTLNVSSLAPDIYVAKIFNGKNWTSIMFIKK